MKKLLIIITLITVGCHPLNAFELRMNNQGPGGMNNNNYKNMLFASGLGASIVGLLTPSAAMAISITDPVFGDIQIWQFLVLTAGYWIGIEMYLDKKYDENTTPIMPTLKKKEEDEEE